jgi:hypothetical protein
MSRTYINNKETGHIELHFTKEEYKAMLEEQKKQLKSNYVWSSTADAWVSRSTKNTWYAEEIAKKLGFEDGGSVGERLTYEEELNRKTEKAEHRAERYEEYSNIAEKRAEQLQAALKSYRGDIAFFTQPIIAGHSGSQAFANYREKLFNRYRKGFEEYEKSEYFKERAATARATAENSKLNDKVYLHNRIQECNKNMKVYQGNIIKYEETLYRLQQGEELKNYKGELLTIERIEKAIEEQLEKYDYEEGKLEFFEKCINDLGGCNFSKDNINVGYIVEVKRWGKCEVISTGKINFQYKILTGGAKGLGGKEPYEAIIKILEIKEVEEIKNPYSIGDILTYNAVASTRIIRAFQVIKVTEKSITIQEINVEKNIPLRDGFKLDSKPERKGIVRVNILIMLEHITTIGNYTSTMSL